MRLKRLDSKSGRAVEVTFSVIGGVWKLIILLHLLPGRKRFMELMRLIPNATQRMLTLQLCELEADGVIARHVYPQVPPRVEYVLTPLGESLAPVLISLREWGESYCMNGMPREPAAPPRYARVEAMVTWNHTRTS